ncbi:hypothetical protein ALC53_00654 [Atta colombica]|uniref:Uncharacterized protein n=1 Tax=Atta colombica TaxID=520822 RepID=A0A195BVV6_9HYME|nr:hypothetical protein ALC53_00654 [Atta colombica]
MYVNHPGIPAASNHLSSETFRLLVVQEQQRMNFKSNINLRSQWLGGCSQSRDVCRFHKLLLVTVVITLAWKRFYAIARLHRPN